MRDREEAIEVDDLDPVPHPSYLAPANLDEALALLAEHAEGAKIVAGGQSLLVLLRQGLIAPRVLIGLKRVEALRALTPTPEGGLRIGAMVTQHALETSPLVRARFPALAEAASVIASPPVRRQGTLGGNLCHADPTGDPPAALIALGAEVELARAGARRHVAVEDLCRDYMEPDLEPDELLVAVRLPPPAARAGSAYLKHRLRGVDPALVGAGVGLALAEDGRICAEARIGLVGAGVTPLRAREAEAALRGQEPTADRIEAAAAAAARECAPLADTQASEWYRREMVAVFVRRAAAIALRRAQGNGSS